MRGISAWKRCGVAVGELLRRDALALGGQRDRLAVLVGAGEEEHVLPALAHVPGEDVGADRRVRVPEVRRRVDVVDRRRDVEGHRRAKATRAGRRFSPAASGGRAARRSRSEGPRRRSTPVDRRRSVGGSARVPAAGEPRPSRRVPERGLAAGAPSGRSRGAPPEGAAAPAAGAAAARRAPSALTKVADRGGDVRAWSCLDHPQVAVATEPDAATRSTSPRHPDDRLSAARERGGDTQRLAWPPRSTHGRAAPAPTRGGAIARRSRRSTSGAVGDVPLRQRDARTRTATRAPTRRLLRRHRVAPGRVDGAGNGPRTATGSRLRPSSASSGDGEGHERRWRRPGASAAS